MMMVVATFALAAAIFMSTAAADCSRSTVQGTSGRFHRPEGGEDGLYIGTVEVDEEGVERHQVKYLGKLGNTTFDGSWPANNNVSRPGGGRARKLLQDTVQDTGAHCQGGIVLEGGEIYYAVTGIADYFGYNGNTMIPHYYMSAYYGCTVAYACNYGDVDLWTTADQIWSDHHFISSACSTFGAGWFDHESWYGRFGRTLATAGFS